MHKKISVTVLIIVGVIAAACGTYYYVRKQADLSSVAVDASSFPKKTPVQENQMVGNDRDSHGCIGSAGYQWCETKQKCLRSWEEACNPSTPVGFVCTGKKYMTAVYESEPSAKVDLTLSDGRKLTLPIAISASGARYANSDETQVFWNKGDTAFLEENGVQTFKDCTVKP